MHFIVVSVAVKSSTLSSLYGVLKAVDKSAVLQQIAKVVRILFIRWLKHELSNRPRNKSCVSPTKLNKRDTFVFPHITRWLVHFERPIFSYASSWMSDWLRFCTEAPTHCSIVHLSQHVCSVLLYWKHDAGCLRPLRRSIRTLHNDTVL